MHNVAKDCYLCGKPADTTDHIPPRGLFSVVPQNIFTVPACRKCNADASKDEEYMRTTLAAFGYWTCAEARQVWDGAVRRSFARRQALRVQLSRGVRTVEVRTPQGQLLGKLPGLEVDGTRALRVMRKIVRGIYYHEQGQRIADDQELVLFRMAEVPPGTVGTAGWREHDMGPVFRYRSTHEACGSGIWFEFYRCEAWLALTGELARNYPRS